jgi:DNA-binding protein HU-beta
LNKTELIEHIATQADISKAAAGRALEALIGGVKATIKIKAAKVPKFRPGKALKDHLN